MSLAESRDFEWGVDDLDDAELKSIVEQEWLKRQSPVASQNPMLGRRRRHRPIAEFEGDEVLDFEMYTEMMAPSMDDYLSLMKKKKRIRKRLFDLGLLKSYPDVQRCATPFYKCMNQKQDGMSKKQRWEECRKRLAETCEGYALFLQPVSRYWVGASKKKTPSRTASPAATESSSTAVEEESVAEAAEKAVEDGTAAAGPVWDEMFERAAAAAAEEDEDDEPPAVPVLSSDSTLREVADIDQAVRAFSALLEAVPVFLAEMTKMQTESDDASKEKAAFRTFFDSIRIERQSVSKLALGTVGSLEERNLMKSVMLLAQIVVTVANALVNLYSAVPTSLYEALDAHVDRFYGTLAQASATVEQQEESSLSSASVLEETSDLGDALQLLRRTVDKTRQTFRVFRAALDQLASSASPSTALQTKPAPATAAGGEGWLQWMWGLVQRNSATFEQVRSVSDAAHRALAKVGYWWYSNATAAASAR